MKIIRNNLKKEDHQYKENEDKYSEKKPLLEALVNLSLAIEASFESGFQFWFQIIYSAPTILLLITCETYQFNFRDIVNEKFLSIFMSYWSFTRIFVNIE